MNGQLVIRNSERTTFRRCRQKWEWSYVQRLSPPRDGGALVFGRFVHEALEVYYPPGRKRGPHPADTFRTLYLKEKAAFDQWDEDGNKVDALDLGCAMLSEYVKEYGDDDYIQIIQPEVPMAIDIHDETDTYLFTWVGKSDAVYRDLNVSTKKVPCIGLLEHKTAKTIEEELRVNSSYGEQGLSYSEMADLWLHHEGLLPDHLHLDHVEYNWLRKAMPDERPKDAHGRSLNQNGAISKRQPPPFFHRSRLTFGPDERRNLNRRLLAEFLEMKMVREGALPIYKNPTRDCAWDCAFRDVCELHEMGHDWSDVLDLEFTTWDPYSDHELEMEKV